MIAGPSTPSNRYSGLSEQAPREQAPREQAPREQIRQTQMPLAQAPRRVVHISLGTHVGGMERLLVEFARFADRPRFALSFVSLQACGPVASELRRLQCDVHSLEKPPGLRATTVLRLARLLRRLRPEIVHTHNASAYLYGVSAAVLVRVPNIVHTRHGRCHEASRRQTWAFRIGSRFVDQVVNVSEDAQQLSIAEGIAAHRTCTILNGVDIDRFAFSGPEIGGPAVVVARLSPEKDIATLLRACQIAARQISNFRLQIVGDGSCRADLEQLTGELGLGSTVRFLGERSDVASILPRCSLFVLPSLTEGISLTLLEAMARGLPTIATRVGGNCEVVVDGHTGLLVPPADPVAMADAICRIQADAVLARRMADAGRQRVEQCFAVGRMVRQYEQLYAQLGTPSG